jgi:hypothetical protein
MSSEKPRPEHSTVILSFVGLAGIAAIMLGGLTADRAGATRFERTEPRETWLGRGLTEHLAEVNAAIARNDQDQAIRAWREAYGIALGSRRWEAMADVGDAAVSIDVLVRRPSGNSTGFRAEARQAYLRALFQARAQRAPDGIGRVADAFAALGDRDMATRARAIEVTR